MKVIKAIALLCISVVATNCYAQQDKPVDLYVMGGQSNLYGWDGDGRFYPKGEPGEDEHILFVYVVPDDNLNHLKWPAGKTFDVVREPVTWTTMGPQMGEFPDGHFGPEVSFARKLRASSSNPVAIFKYSLPSTDLATWWLPPGKNGLYDDMVKQLSAAIMILQRSGFTPQIKGFIWVQGESDGTETEWARKYKERLAVILDDFSSNVAHAPVPVVLGLDEKNSLVLKNPIVLTAQEELARTRPCTGRASMAGLSMGPMGHLSPSALVTYGERLFDVLQKTRKRCEK